MVRFLPGKVMAGCNVEGVLPQQNAGSPRLSVLRGHTTVSQFFLTSPALRTHPR